MSLLTFIISKARERVASVATAGTLLTRSQRASEAGRDSAPLLLTRAPSGGDFDFGSAVKRILSFNLWHYAAASASHLE